MTEESVVKDKVLDGFDSSCDLPWLLSNLILIRYNIPLLLVQVQHRLSMLTGIFMALSIHIVVCNFFDAVVFALPIAMNDVSGVVMDVKMVATRLHVDPSNVPTIGEVLLSRSQSNTDEPVLIDLHL